MFFYFIYYIIIVIIYEIFKGFTIDEILPGEFEILSGETQIMVFNNWYEGKFTFNLLYLIQIINH